MVSLFGIKILQHTVWTAYCNCLDICFWIACTSMLIRKHFKAYFFLAVSFFFFMPFSQENLANFQDWADSILLFKTSVSSHATKHNKGGSHWTWFVTIKMRTIDINGILFQQLFWLTMRKKCSRIRENLLNIWGWSPRICKIFEIPRTIYYFKRWKVRPIFETEYFFIYFGTGGFYGSNTLEQLKCQLEQIIWM